MPYNKNKTSSPPQDFETLKAIIIDRQQDLPKRLTQVAEYALRCPDEIAFGTTKSIACAAGVQPSTTVRLANHLGYDGFSAFQSIFRQRLLNRPISYEDRFSALESNSTTGSEEASILQGSLATTRSSLGWLQANIDMTTLKESIELLARADNVYILAKRRAYPLAAHLAYLFAKLKIRHLVVGSAIGNDHDLLEAATAHDAVIAASFSPYAPETVTQLQQMVRKKAAIIGITDSPFSPLAASSTLWFEIVEADYAGFRSLSASFLLASTLAVATAQRRRSKNLPVLHSEQDR